MLATVPTVTVLVATVNVAVVAPAATITEVGTVAALLLLVNATTAPPAGAAALSVTVPVLFAPPVTVAGFSVIEASTGTIFTMKPSFPRAGSGCTAPATERGVGAGGTGKSHCGAHKRPSL